MTLLLAMDERQKSGEAIQMHKNSEVGKKCQHNRQTTPGGAESHTKTGSEKFTQLEPV